jgi:hypothetical protein
MPTTSSFASGRGRGPRVVIAKLGHGDHLLPSLRRVLLDKSAKSKLAQCWPSYCEMSRQRK